MALDTEKLKDVLHGIVSWLPTTSEGVRVGLSNAVDQLDPDTAPPVQVDPSVQNAPDTAVTQLETRVAGLESGISDIISLLRPPVAAPVAEPVPTPESLIAPAAPVGVPAV